LFYGSCCEKHDVNKLAEERHCHIARSLRRMRGMTHLSYVETVHASCRRGGVGIPRNMFFLRLLPFFTDLYRLLPAFRFRCGGQRTKH
jgi:hypothetical protein